MGEHVLKYYKKIKKEYKISFFFTFFVSLLIHFYKFCNMLPNHDSVYNYYSDQSVIGSGRWALSLSCGISSYYDLPWVIGIISCIYLALTVVVITALFRLKNPILIGLTSVILAASPSTTETFFFLFTADGYMLAMLLSALAVYCSRIEEHRVSRTILSIVLICISCGIYQAYVSFALILALCYFMDVLLRGLHTKKECLNWIGKQILIYTVSLVAYYIIWQIVMKVTGTAPNNYQGISDVGTFHLSMLLHGLLSSIKTVLFYFLQWNVLAHGFTLYSVLHILLLSIFALGLIFAAIKSKLLQRKWALFLFVLCLLAFIPFACIWNFVSNSVGYRPMMLQCLSLVLFFTALLYEHWFRPRVKDLVCLFLVVLLGNNAIMANISYFYLQLGYERTYAQGLEMVLHIHQLQDEFQINDIMVIGNRLSEIQWTTDVDVDKTIPAEHIHMLSSLIETNLFSNQEHTLPILRNTFGLDIPTASSEKQKALKNSNTVKNMPCWPDGGSVAEIDGTVIIKLANEGT